MTWHKQRVLTKKKQCQDRDDIRTSQIGHKISCFEVRRPTATIKSRNFEHLELVVKPNPTEAKL